MCSSSPGCQLSTEDVCVDGVVLHMVDTSQPPGSVLSEQGVHAGEACTRQDLSLAAYPARMGPEYAYGFQMESVSSFLSGVCCRHLGIVRRHLCLQPQLGVLPRSSYQASKVCSCLPHHLVDLCVSGKVAGSSEVKIWELMNDIAGSGEAKM